MTQQTLTNMHGNCTWGQADFIFLILLKEKTINTGFKIIMFVEWSITHQAESQNTSVAGVHE